MHSRDATVLIDLLWFNVMHYSSLFWYFFSIYYGPYSSWKFLIFLCTCTIKNDNIVLLYNKNLLAVYPSDVMVVYMKHKISNNNDMMYHTNIHINIIRLRHAVLSHVIEKPEHHTRVLDN